MKHITHTNNIFCDEYALYARKVVSVYVLSVSPTS